MCFKLEDRKMMESPFGNIWGQVVSLNWAQSVP